MKAATTTEKIFITSAILFVIISLPILASKALKISFSPQAPYAHWEQPWQDACEETSIIIVDSFYHNQELNPAQAQQNIESILNIKNKFYGQSYDENAQKIADIINNFLLWEATVIENPSLQQIKTELDNNRPVIMPVHGRELQNPYMNTTNLDYHVLVISGYDDQAQQFITQEPGTQSGANFRYSYNNLLSAMHDFLPKDMTHTGTPVAIFTNPTIDLSRKLDGDQDGLTKEQEIQHKTNLANPDTDNDGYSDYEEVINFYSPLVAEMEIQDDSLLKSTKTNKVYWLSNKQLHHIVNSKVMKSHNWNWTQVVTVSEKFLNKFQLADPLLK